MLGRQPTKHNPACQMAPEGSRHHIADIRRILRALGRSNFWQCPVCDEIFPPKTPSILSVCCQCWVNYQDLDTHLDLEQTPKRTLAGLYLKWIKEGRIYDLIGPTGTAVREPSINPPAEFDYLMALQHWFGDDQIKEALTSQSLIDVRIYFHPDRCVWVNNGWLIPRAAQRSELPAPTDLKAWEKIRKLAYSEIPK